MQGTLGLSRWRPGECSPYLRGSNSPILITQWNRKAKEKPTLLAPDSALDLAFKHP
jgi:hypothetical protein